MTLNTAWFYGSREDPREAGKNSPLALGDRARQIFEEHSEALHVWCITTGPRGGFLASTDWFRLADGSLVNQHGSRIDGEI